MWLTLNQWHFCQSALVTTQFFLLFDAVYNDVHSNQWSLDLFQLSNIDYNFENVKHIAMGDISMGCNMFPLYKVLKDCIYICLWCNSCFCKLEQKTKGWILKRHKCFLWRLTHLTLTESQMCEARGLPMSHTWLSAILSLQKSPSCVSVFPECDAVTNGPSDSDTSYT